MSRLVAIPLLAIALIPSTAFAQFGGMGGMGGGFNMNEAPSPSWPQQSWTVKVETAGGKTVSGALALVSVTVDCDLGRYHIRPESIKSVRFHRPDQGTVAGPEGRLVGGAVVPQSGEEIAGVIVVWNWTLQTDLGQVTLDPSKLRAVTFIGKAEPPAKARPAARAMQPDEPK